MSDCVRRYAAECLGTAGLLCAVIGSGIMGEALANGNVAVALLANTLATVFALFVLIEVFGPISGAHFNPAVSLAMLALRQLTARDFFAYTTAQLMGAALGAWLAHAMFNLDVFQLSSKVRTGHGQWLAEVVATTGLLLVIFRVRKEVVALSVAFYIGAAYWFTASTSFANPAAVLVACFPIRLRVFNLPTHWVFVRPSWSVSVSRSRCGDFLANPLLIKHIWLGLNQVIPNRLKVQPTDVFASHMLTAIT